MVFVHHTSSAACYCFILVLQYLSSRFVAAQNVLFYTETSKNRHGVIDFAYDAVQTPLQDHGWNVTRTDVSEGYFTPTSLNNYDVVVFFYNTGDDVPGILDSNEKAAFQEWYRAGKGVVGVHSAADTYQTAWPWYNQLIGAGFRNHPEIQEATVRIEDPSFDAVNHLPENWTLTDEWYNFDYAYDPPRSRLHVIASVDESTYSGGTNGLDHPIIWCQYFDGGRSFYTGLGHKKSNWLDPAFVQHVVGGVTWAGGERAPPPIPSHTPSPTNEPSPSPINEPSPSPTKEPSPSPTKDPSPPPTKVPTYPPIPSPTPTPTSEPSPSPTKEPTYPPIPSPTPAPLHGLLVVHAINAGAGEPYVSEDGISYKRDYGYSSDNSGTYGSEAEITGTNDDILYQRERHLKSEFNSFSYSLNVVEGKTYRITFKLAELFWKADPEQYSGWERIFDILVEGEVVFDNVNIFARVGALNKAYDLHYEYTAADSVLDIEFRKGKKSAKVNAILVEELPSSTQGPTNIPTKLQTPSPTKEPTHPPIPYLAYVGDNGEPAGVFPLKLCEGDCDKNSECDEGLQCFRRGGFDAVPGCDGRGESGKDYCIPEESHDHVFT